MSDDRLPVVLCWHMHQPQYRDLVSGAYSLPWAYLHAIKDYTDMAWHLEQVPQARAVVNFAPILLEQLDDYSAQIRGFLENDRPLRDPLLAALAGPVLPVSLEARADIIRSCLRANDNRLIRRFAPYQRLADIATWALAHPQAAGYLAGQFLADLLVWYHLAWLGESVRRGDARVRRLMGKESGYSLHDRRELLALIGELHEGIVPRYRALAEAGRVELSVTPYAHPILPLLLDMESAREAMPNAVLPPATRYPGGGERARWHIQEGIAVFERRFGRRPAGCWPAEGAVSEATLRLLGEAGFRWAATGEAVLRNSLHRAGHAEHAMKAAWLYRPYAVADSGVRCFFRDDGLSDLIGFTYATWHADDAVANFVHHLETIAETCREHRGHVVSIILDGENAWEHYPENAYYFLSALYRRLAGHPRLRLSTFSECLDIAPVRTLKSLVAGSWVYGTFSTWIGSVDKNRGWEMLEQAKHVYDESLAALGAERREAATRQLAVCEGSDWFWWFGDENPAATVADFERLYRQHLSNLYQCLHRAPPEYLAQVFTRGGGAPALGGVMKPGQQK
jgi:alpha-amylase/alpha-mannosidase (GH57 family)